MGDLRDHVPFRGVASVWPEGSGGAELISLSDEQAG
jgi:hypothetical protein